LQGVVRFREVTDVEGYVVGVDLGGTKILTALADLQGRVLSKSRQLTKAKEGPEAIINQIVASIEEVTGKANIDNSKIRAVGVGCPGPLNVEKGIIYNTPNLNLKNVNIKEVLEAKLTAPVFIENDANAAALGEKWFGAGQERDDLIYMTISTGIGGGIIINRRLYHGANDSAGEIGHIVIDPTLDVECGCGDQGCWEAIASGTAIGRLGREAIKQGKQSKMTDLVSEIEEIDGATVTKAAANGDKVALGIIERVTNYLGIGVANLVNILNPEMVIIGGGVTKAGKMILEPIREIVAERALDAPAGVVEIVSAELGDDVGVIGAIAKALVEIGVLL